LFYLLQFLLSSCTTILKKKGNNGIINLVRDGELIELVINLKNDSTQIYVEMRIEKSELDDLYCSEVNINIMD